MTVNTTSVEGCGFFLVVASAPFPPPPTAATIPFVVSLILSIDGAWSSLVEGDEGSYLPKW